MTLRPALLAAAALATALYASLALSRWGAGGNRDLAAVTREFRRGEELAPHIEAGQRREEARRALAAEVVAGRLSLREATGSFRRLDEAAPFYPPGLAHSPGYERALRHSVLDWAWEVLGQQQRYAAAARGYAEVFTADPQLLAGPSAKYRYRAVCAAARAGFGQGRDAADLDEKTRAGFRRQALGWLRAELEAQRRLLEQEPERPHGAVADDLQRWLADASFAGVREPDALGRLPAAERQAWHKLWADVADTLARALETTRQELEARSKVRLPAR
jgi:hypothetical protein